MIDSWSKELVIQRLLSITLLVILLALCFKIIQFFIVPALWAAIIASVTFPVYNFFHTKAKFSYDFSALIMTVVVSLIIGVPLVIGVFILQAEVLNFYELLQLRIQAGYVDLPDNIKDLPIVGQHIKDILWKLNKDPESTMETLGTWIQSHLYYGKIAIDAVIRNGAKLGMTVMTLFFFYRDGINLMKQVRQALRNIIGNRIDDYINSVAVTTQAVVYGIGLTALAQALLAGIGYLVAGAPNPLLLMIATFIIAFIPMGTPFAWGGVSLWLMSQGQTTEGIGLALWGVFAVSSVDNLIRPIVISGATKIPFMIIFIGVLGGLTAFGFVGLFLGPVVLAIGLAVWREWISQHKNELFSSNHERQLSLALEKPAIKQNVKTK